MGGPDGSQRAERNGAGARRARQGHPRRRREQRHDQEAVRRDRRRVHRGRTAATTARCCSRTKGAGDYISGVILFDETIRQTAADGTPLVEAARGPGHHPRHQGRRRREAARVRGGRDGHRGPRRPARSGSPSTGSSARASPSGARRTRSPTSCRPPTASTSNAHALGALRRAVPGGGHRADRGARGADGGRPHHRARLRRHQGGAGSAVPRAVRAAVRVRGHAAQAEHGAARATTARSRCPTKTSRKQPCGASGGRFPPRCPASCSCRAGSPTSRPPRG